MIRILVHQLFMATSVIARSLPGPPLHLTVVPSLDLVNSSLDTADGLGGFSQPRVYLSAQSRMTCVAPEYRSSAPRAFATSRTLTG